MTDLIKKYKSVLLYLIFGVLTTLVNVISYWIFVHIAKLAIMMGTVFAWVLAVIFAYLTNRKWVFRSEATTFSAIIKEIISFFSCRLATGAVDWACMLIFADWLLFNDMCVKIAANFIVIILNYLASKWIIFKHS